MGNARRRRLTEERAGGAKSVFHFNVQGSVAKSTHAGIPWLRFIRQRLGDCVHFWPFIPSPRSIPPCGPYPNSRVTSRHFELGEGGDSGVHVDIEPPVGVHMLPDQRCQRVQVSGVQSAGPVRASENPLEHLQRQKLDGVGRRTGHRRSLHVGDGAPAGRRGRNALC